MTNPRRGAVVRLPVGVVRSSDAVLNDANRVADHLGYSPDSPVLAAAPLFHAYGFNYGLIGPLVTGTTTRYCSARSVPSQLGRLARAHGVRTLIALPFHYTLLADALLAGVDTDFAGRSDDLPPQEVHSLQLLWLL